MSMHTILVFHRNFINSKEIIAMHKECVKSSEKNTLSENMPYLPYISL